MKDPRTDPEEAKLLASYQRAALPKERLIETHQGVIRAAVEIMANPKASPSQVTQARELIIDATWALEALVLGVVGGEGL